MVLVLMRKSEVADISQWKSLKKAFQRVNWPWVQSIFVSQKVFVSTQAPSLQVSVFKRNLMRLLKMYAQRGFYFS